MKKILLFLPFTFLLFTCLISAQTLAPGSPGKDAQWASAGKQGVGTSATLESKVWFTLQGGVMTEVYYPNVAVGNVHLLQFVVVNSKTKKVETERDDAVHKMISEEDYYGNPDYLSRGQIIRMRSSGINLPLPKKVSEEDRLIAENSLQFIQENVSKTGKWTIKKRYITDVENNTVLIRVNFSTSDKNLQLYLMYDPSLSNSGMGDTAWNDGKILYSQDKNIASALLVGDGRNSEGVEDINNGFYKTSDGLEQLQTSGKLITPYAKADDGNVAQLAKIVSKNKKSVIFTVSLGFGNTPTNAVDSASKSLKKGFDKTYENYVRGWNNYVKTLPKVDPKYQAQFNMAAMILKAHEDKIHRGANIASMSVPWGGGDNANEDNVGGYHLVWSRDLYQVFTAYMALGDRAAAERALDFLLKVQQKPDGSFPQNSWLDGKPFWGSLQMDEVAYPLIMAYQLKRFDKETYTKHLKPAADFIVKNGPATPQERWEEEGGYSPSTIAAEIAGLVCAAEIAKQNGDEASATIYLATADDWARKVEMWTATTTGKYGDGNYYLRITQNGKPDAGSKIELNNGAGFFDEREIVDAGFLELVRLGIKSSDDPLIAKSVKVIDEVIKVNTPNGEGFYRYNHDGYGEMDDGRRWNWDGKYTGKGRLWVLLSGERGQYELARQKFYLDKVNLRPPFDVIEKDASSKKYPPVKPSIDYLISALKRLDSMQKFANNGLMIPEQVWDKKEVPEADSQFSPNLQFGEGTGSATPLAWSMAQFIRLAVNLQEGRNLDTPDVVYERYVKKGIPSKIADFGSIDEIVALPVKAGEKFNFARKLPKGTKIGYIYQDNTHFVEAEENGEVSVEITAPEKEEIVVIGTRTPDGATAFERVKVSSMDKVEEKKSLTETFEKIRNAKVSPLIEDGKAIFFYKDEAKNVMLAGDMTGWSPRISMQKIGENLFAVELNISPSARVEYKLVVDGKWITDPLNANNLNNGVGGENSVLEMPEYEATVWDKETNDPLINKKVSELEIDSKKYGKRTVKIYVPSEYYKRDNAPKLSVLYMFDGSDYLMRAKAINVLENLIVANKVKPFMLVFTDPVDRMKEYFASDDFADYIAKEVVPAVEQKYFNTVKTGRENRALLGASLGGVTSVWIGLKHPDKFANIGGQSSSFWVENEKTIKALEKLKGDEKFNFYFDDGTFEGVEDTRRVNVMLRGKGFPVTYVEGETGHNWTSWRDRLAEAFIALMGK